MFKTKLKIILGSIVGVGLAVLGFLLGHRTSNKSGFSGNDSGGTGIDSASLRQSVDSVAERNRDEQAKLAEIADAIGVGTDYANLSGLDAKNALDTARQIRDTAKSRQNTNSD